MRAGEVKLYLQKLTILSKDLHARTFVAAIADDVFAGVAENGHFSRVPQLTLVTTGNAELKLEFTALVEHLVFMQYGL